MRIRINATPENRNLSPGNLPPEKINGNPNLWTEKSNLFSVEKRVAAKRLSISFITVQGLPYRLAKDAINLDSHESRLFEDPGITVLDEQKTSQHAVSVKPKIPQDNEPLFRQAAAAQGTIHRQKG
jgi:hypothetical protein